MKETLLRFALVTLVFVAFTAIHEAGHYAAAAYFDLKPELVFGEPTAEGLITGLVGVSHEQSMAFERQIVILSALIPPFVIGGAMRFADNEWLQLTSMAFLALAVIALLPLPGSDMANLLSLIG